jgi:outer membrane protein TolC
MNQAKRFGRGVGHGLASMSLVGVLALASPAAAQPAKVPAPVAPPALTPGQPAAAAAAPAATAPALPAADVKPAAPAETKPDPLAEELSKKPGGLTLDEVARLALKSKPSLRAKQAELQAAAAKVDQAFVGYFPRVSVAFAYTRLSEVDNSLRIAPNENGQVPVSLGTLIDAKQGAAQIVTAPCSQNASATCVYTADPKDPTKVGSPVFAAPTSLKFPSVLDSYSFTASLAVPVSDYLLRVTQGYAAASHAEKSKKIELEAETLTSAADAKVAYLNWVRAKGQTFVAKEAVALAKAHVEDVKRLKVVGYSSQADVLRGEAQVAAAEQVEVEVEAFASIAEEQVRIGLALPKDKVLAIGIDVMNISPPAALPQLSALQDQALEKRLEIRSLDETELSLKEVENVTRAGLYPRVDLFADLTVGNPNQRYTFAGAQWNTTWDAGVRVSWTINDTLTATGAVAESKSRVTQIAEQKKALRDGLRLEVAAAYAEIKKSTAQIDSAARGLTASEESLRVRRELIFQGKATTVELLDSEIEVTRARLRKLDAQIGLIVAQIKFDHAIGNDVGTTRAPDAAAAANGEAKGDDASAKKPTTVAAVVPPPLLPLAK